MEESQEFGNYAFDGIGHEYLVAVKLDLVLLYLDVAFYFGEVKYPCELEGIIDVKMDIEKRFITGGI
jgi:hypothetical protein